jgi:hypothetical protein
LFGRQALGKGADPYRCADEDAASYLYFHALFDADAGTDTYLHTHATATDGNTSTDSNADTRRGNSRTADTHGDAITATHQHSRSTSTPGYANPGGSACYAHASIRVYDHAIPSRHRVGGGDEGHSLRG